MKFHSDLEHEVLRLRLVEKWPVGTIAKEYGIHHSVVRRVERDALMDKECGEIIRARRLELADDFLDFIKITLERYPKIRATRLFTMVRGRGYKGVSKGHFRRLVKRLRPKKSPEAFLRLSTLRGEQGQVDWGEFGAIPVLGGKRKLYGFVLTLSHSRAVFLKFFLSGRLADFEQGFADAFEFFCGVPRQVLLDNLKSGVTERVGKLIRYNEKFLHFASHYRFEPVACAPRRGNEKGRVERAIRYIRDNFFEAREWKDLDDLNAQALEWCKTESMQRPWARGDARTIRDVFEEEKQALMAVPAAAYPIFETISVSIAKTPYARFDTNDYSVPARFVRTNLTVSASTTAIEILDGVNVVAKHPRSYSKHQTFIDIVHIKDVLAQKRDAARSSGQYRLLSSVASSDRFLELLSLRGQNMGGCVTSLLKLLDIHGAQRLESAISEVVQSGSSQLRSVHLVLQRLEKQIHEPEPPAVIQLDSRLANIIVQHHDLSKYDKIAGSINSNDK
jgi:transposase